jgi:hypothetical protein
VLGKDGRNVEAEIPTTPKEGRSPQSHDAAMMPGVGCHAQGRRVIDEYVLLWRGQRRWVRCESVP